MTTDDSKGTDRTAVRGSSGREVGLQAEEQAFKEADRIVEILEEPDWVARCERAEARIRELEVALQEARDLYEANHG
jgi:hypothetical protein